MLPCLVWGGGREEPVLSSKGRISPARGALRADCGPRRDWLSGPRARVVLLEAALNLSPEGCCGFREAE